MFFARIVGRTVSAGTVAGFLNRTGQEGIEVPLVHRDDDFNRTAILVASERPLDLFIEGFRADTVGVLHIAPLSVLEARRMFEAMDERWPYEQVSR